MDPQSPSSADSSRPVVAPRIDADAFRLLVESTVDYAIFMLDPDGRVITWNSGAERIKGYSANEIIGHHFSMFYPPDANARDWPAFELTEAARVGRFEDEGWRVRKDGTRFWANVVITALRDPDGGLRGFAKVTRDITERKAYEERIQNLTRELQARVAELAATNRELAQKSAENESFVYSVSHDLRTPLVNLQGFSHELALTSKALAELLKDSSVPASTRQRASALVEGDVAESIGFIGDAVRHLSGIIDALLRLSRAGGVEYESVPVEVGTVVTHILSAMRGSVDRAGATVTVGPLPVIRGDRSAIGQIFANVIGNALKHFDRQRPGTIEITASGDSLPVFAVRDNGVGIPEEYHSKVFQPFQRVHGDRTAGEGMGLAIVRRIVERHDGRIWFESVPGRGTTFLFTLGPAVSAADGPAPDAG